MKLKALSLSDVEQVRLWRNQQLESLRTPFLLTMEQQVQFYHDVICNRQANARYWGIWLNDDDSTIAARECNFIGMCGLESISWENRNAEISLIFNPNYSMGKYGEEALQLLLHEGFMNMNLENIFTEVYESNPHLKFWIDSHLKYKSKNYTIQTLEGRKYFNGKYYDSFYITFNKERYYENTIS